jgi:hypothetical protein
MKPETDIKDYLHLYLGCQAIIKDDDGADRKFHLNAYNLNYYRDWISAVKPILRPLDDMTEEEAQPLCQMQINGLQEGDRATISQFNMFYKRCEFYIHHSDDPELHVYRFLSFKEFNPKQFAYLLSKGFDLFGLIDAGLAIEKRLTPETK